MIAGWIDAVDPTFEAPQSLAPCDLSTARNTRGELARCMRYPAATPDLGAASVPMPSWEGGSQSPFSNLSRTSQKLPAPRANGGVYAGRFEAGAEGSHGWLVRQLQAIHGSRSSAPRQAEDSTERDHVPRRAHVRACSTFCFSGVDCRLARRRPRRRRCFGLRSVSARYE